MMSVKKEKWLPIKEILFSYLAISKTVYWVDTISAMDQSDFGDMFSTVLVRLLNRDILLIMIVIFFYFLNKFIEKKFQTGNVFKYTMYYIVGYVAMIGIFYIYTWILSWFFPLEFPSLGETVSNSIGGYAVIVVVLNIKYYFKEKEKDVFKDTPPVGTTDDNLAMLKALLEDGVLTQEEFDHKKVKVLGI